MATAQPNILAGIKEAQYGASFYALHFAASKAEEESLIGQQGLHAAVIVQLRILLESRKFGFLCFMPMKLQREEDLSSIVLINNGFRSETGRSIKVSLGDRATTLSEHVRNML